MNWALRPRRSIFNSLIHSFPLKEYKLDFDKRVTLFYDGQWKRGSLFSNKDFDLEYFPHTTEFIVKASEEWSCWSGPDNHARCWEFHDTFNTAEYRRDEPYKVDAAVVASHIWAAAVAHMQEAIGSRALEVWARIGRPTADFSIIAPDTWRYFEVNDWAKGKAEANGDSLFSVHLCPAERAPSAPVPLAGTIAQEKECRRALEHLMRSHPHDPSPKDEVYQDMLKTMPGLPRKLFDRAWALAIVSTSAIAWGRPGPRKKR